MKKAMKRIMILPMLFVLGLLLVSCGEETKKEWKGYYGYTNGDIIGTYSYSNVSNAFEGLMESNYCHLCDDAEITIRNYSEASVEFTINCPQANFHKTFTGKPTLNENDNVIHMSIDPATLNPVYDVMAYVYINEANEIRLHGFARKNIYHQDEEPYSINYYFDVVKN